MAYDPNALALVTESPLQGGGQVWRYISAADAKATIYGANYFSDALNKGVKVNDTIISTGTDATWTSQVTAVAAAGATLSTGIQIS